MATEPTKTTDTKPVSDRAYSNATWENQGHQVVAGQLRSWTESHDLAVQLWKSPDNTLTWPQARALVSAASNGLPLILTWETPFGDNEVEVHTTAVVVDRLSVWPGRSDRVRVKYWGFAHDVYLSRVTDVLVPSQTTTYRKR